MPVIISVEVSSPRYRNGSRSLKGKFPPYSANTINRYAAKQVASLTGIEEDKRLTSKISEPETKLKRKKYIRFTGRGFKKILKKDSTK
jgi:hypothetical protein